MMASAETVPAVGPPVQGRQSLEEFISSIDKLEPAAGGTSKENTEDTPEIQAAEDGDAPSLLDKLLPSKFKQTDDNAGASPLGTMAVLQVLNKITARNSVLKIRAGSASSFGNLDIRIRDCWKAPPESRPEASVLMEVWEKKPGESEAMIFRGWMFASTPALSALEHPVYDIVVLDCLPWKEAATP